MIFSEAVNTTIEERIANLESDIAIYESIACDAAKLQLKVNKSKIKPIKAKARLCREKTDNESKAKCLQSVSDSLDNLKNRIKGSKETIRDRCFGSKVKKALGKGAKKAGQAAKKVAGKAGSAVKGAWDNLSAMP